MKNVARNIKRGKSSEGKAEVQYQRTAASRDRLDSLKETAKKRPLSHEEELDVLDAIFGTDPL